ncbi:hypothetical protein CCACVL1_13091 [Corchorus capsularis]|uniref:Protein kinase domain-containing protein n=1 Tax=Corchorus capsularis TaxID=210143 RepID=A0A1R3ICL4_COCAP|nr:hypothetical protein CCACVL1_13091 [Corchorus capsularis]
MKEPVLLFLAIVLLSSVTVQASNCNRSCGGGKLFPYPFGFSSGCQIPLNCSNRQSFLAGFPIISIADDRIKISIDATCDRPIQDLYHLYGANYAPTYRNTILLQNCSVATPCMIPTTTVYNLFKALSCSSNISCYSENKTNGYVDYDSVIRTNCKSFFSSISEESFNESGVLEIRVVELGYWLEGRCPGSCSENAICDEIYTRVNGRPGFRCSCKPGFVGDGYRAGDGCRRDKKSTTNVPMVTGLTIAGAALAGIGIGMLILCCKQQRKKIINKRGNQNVRAFMENYGSLAPKRYSHSDVKKMTSSFKDKLGQGGYGSVYKGKLPNGQLVAVKVLNESKGNGEEFINEVASISRTSHVNVVTLLGFCYESSKRALIYEFMPNGSLDRFIYDKKHQNTSTNLEWRTLYEITLGIARGLEYLHQGCNTRILHFDIKPHNILLDEQFRPRISDFGLAKLCQRKESIVSMLGARGTAGYMAPEVYNRSFGEVSHKSDVYSFGMMVLEMAGGRRNIDVDISHTSEIYFPHWIYKQLESGQDLKLHRVVTEDDEKLARKMILVSLWCIQIKPSDRPSMKKVVEMLEGSLESLPTPPQPYLSSPVREQLLSSPSSSYLERGRD